MGNRLTCGQVSSHLNQTFHPSALHKLTSFFPHLNLSLTAEISKILIIGATGYIEKFIADASVKAGHPIAKFTAERDPSLFLQGDRTDHESLVKAIKQVDIVISTLGGEHVTDQGNIIAAIKEAGKIKRFLPSEFGPDVDRHNAAEPTASSFEAKAKIRGTTEGEGIPYTCICSNAFAGYFLPNLGQLNAKAPPWDKVVIQGDGNVKGVYVTEEDIASYTVKAVDDPRTLNKAFYIRPPANVLTFNQLISLWENKIGNKLEKIYVSESQLLKNIQESSYPLNLLLAICHSMLVKGDSALFEIDPSRGVEASELYPEVKYTTMDQYLNQFV